MVGECVKSRPTLFQKHRSVVASIITMGLTCLIMMVQSCGKAWQISASKVGWLAGCGSRQEPEGCFQLRYALSLQQQLLISHNHITRSIRIFYLITILD